MFICTDEKNKLLTPVFSSSDAAEDSWILSYYETGIVISFKPVPNEPNKEAVYHGDELVGYIHAVEAANNTHHL